MESSVQQQREAPVPAMTGAHESDSPEAQGLTLPQVIGSVLAAGLGVQSRENKLRDFSRGRPLHFVIAGLAFTAVLLGLLVTVVTLVV